MFQLHYDVGYPSLNNVYRSCENVCPQLANC